MLEMRKNWFGLTAVAAVTVVSVGADAAFVTPTSWDRGIGGTTYQAWDVFSDDDGDGANNINDSTPDVANVNGNGTATLSESGGNGAFLTGGGNIYSFGGVTDFTVTIPEADVPVPPHDVTAIVQIATLGTEVDYASVLLNGIAAVDTAELSRGGSGSPFGGSTVEGWFLFNVPYANFGDGDGLSDDLTLTFNASGSSMSLDRLSIDTAIRPFGFFAEANPIPEPASLMLVAAGGLLVASRRRSA